MTALPPAMLTTGKRYEGNQQYAGSGVKRSCGKCSMHVPIGQLKALKPWGLACDGCRK
jgi:hypothetical protein